MNENYCVYIHSKPCGDIFYVGIGTLKRSKDKWSRSVLWKRIVNKYGYYITIISRDVSKNTACSIERMLISFYGRIDKKTGILANLSDGGESNRGVILSEETRMKISLTAKNRVFSDEHKKNLSITSKGIKKSKEHAIKCKESAVEWSKNNIGNRSKIVICTETGNEWNSLRELSQTMEMSYDSLKGRLNGRIKNNTTYKYKNNE